MKFIKLLTFILFISVIVSCSSSEKPATENEVTEMPIKTENEKKVENETKVPEENLPKMKEVFPVKSYSQNTPTEAMTTFAKAQINKDAEGIRKTLSKGSLKMIAESAEDQGVSVEKILLNENRNSLTEVPQISNEKIKGNTATVDVKNKALNSYDVMPLVKEDGEWKVALDKFMEDLMKRLTEDMKNPPPKK